VSLLDEVLLVDVAAGGELDDVRLGGGFEDVEEAEGVVNVKRVVGVLVGGGAGLVSCAKDEVGRTMERKRSAEENDRLDLAHRQDRLDRRESILPIENIIMTEGRRIRK
jgi:hypothetical protein